NVFLQCNYSLSTNAASFSASAASASVNLTTSAGCPWTVVNSNSWITITSLANGSGNVTVNYQVAANPTLFARTGTVSIAGQTFTVNQAGIVCSYALSSAGQTHTASAETNSFNVITTNPCPWSVSNTNTWIILLGGSNGAGNGPVTYAVEANGAL